MTVHPEQLRVAVDSLARRMLKRLSRCAKGCFCEADGRTLTYEGNRLMADLRIFARVDHRLNQHAFLRDGAMRIDPLSMARMEGRREVVWRLQRLLDLDETQIRELVELKDE